MQTHQLKPFHGDTQPIPLIHFRNENKFLTKAFWVDALYKVIVTCILFLFVSYVQMATASTDIEREKVSHGSLFYKSAHAIPDNPVKRTCDHY